MNRMAFLSCIAIVLVTSVVYGAGVLRNEFVEWDDGLLITNNPIIQGLNWDNLKAAFTSYDPELYIPLTLLTYQIDEELWGLNPVGFHLTNLLLHIGNSLLVMGLVFLLLFSPPPRGEGQGEGVKRKFLYPLSLALSPGERGISIIAFVSALLFAIHPLNTEAVMWASARKDLLMGFFFLLSLNLYMRWNHSCHGEYSEPRSQNTNDSKWYYASLVMFVLACLSKVTAVMLPFILLLIDWRDEPHPRRSAAETYITSRARSWARNLQEKIPYFLISLLFIFIALFGKSGSHGLWWEKVLIGGKATMFYLQKLFWPTGLSVLYPYTEKISVSNPDLWVPLILVLLLTILPLSLALSRGEREYKEWVFGWFFFLLLLLPSFTNFAKGQDILKDVYFASDRYAYLASIGIIFSFASFSSFFSCLSFRTFFAGLLGIIGLLGFLSYHQSFVWQTTESLFTNVVQHYPNAHVAQNNLGSLLYRRGEVDRAIEKYKESLAIRPNATAFFNLGVIYMDNGYPEIAREAFTQALKLNPGDAEARANLGSLP